MAMSKCPECGKELSNTVEKCIHCGCEVKICPECKQLALSSAESCPVCGFSFAVAEKNEEAEAIPELQEEIKEEKTKITLAQAYDGWHDKKKYEGLRKKLELLSIFFVVMLFTHIIVCIVNNFFGGLSYIFIAISSVLIAVSFSLKELICKCSQTSIEVSFYHYCLDKGFSITDMLSIESTRKYNSMSREEKQVFSKKVFLATNAEFYAQTKYSKTQHLVLSNIAIVIFGIIMFTLLLLLPLILKFMNSVNSSTMTLILIFLIIISFIAYFVIRSIPKRKTSIHNTKLEWISKSCPAARTMMTALYKDATLSEDFLE